MPARYPRRPGVEPMRSTPNKLTKFDRDVISMVGYDQTAQELAEAYGVSTRTITQVRRDYGLSDPRRK